MTLGANLHATWDILAFAHNGLDPKSKHALSTRGYLYLEKKYKDSIFQQH